MMKRTEVISNGTKRYISKLQTGNDIKQVLNEAIMSEDVATISDLINFINNRSPHDLIINENEIRQLDSKNEIRNLLKKLQEKDHHIQWEGDDKVHDQLKKLSFIKNNVYFGSQETQSIQTIKSRSQDPRDSQPVVTDNFFGQNELQNMINNLQETLKTLTP